MTTRGDGYEIDGGERERGYSVKSGAVGVEEYLILSGRRKGCGKQREKQQYGEG